MKTNTAPLPTFPPVAPGYAETPARDLGPAGWEVDGARYPELLRDAEFWARQGGRL